jgi:hypothetical protein
VVASIVLLVWFGHRAGTDLTSLRDSARRMADERMPQVVERLQRGAGQQLRGGEPRQTIVELDSMFLFVTTAGQGTSLAVTATVEANVSPVAYEMAVLVRRMGKYLTARSRTSGEQGGGPGRNHGTF